MTADHHRRLALVENQAEALVDYNYQHEYDSYLSSLRMMHDEMDESLNTEISARNLAVQDSEAMRSIVHDYQAEVWALQRNYSSQLSEASVTTQRMLYLENAEAQAHQQVTQVQQAVTQELQAQQSARRGPRGPSIIAKRVSGSTN